MEKMRPAGTSQINLFPELQLFSDAQGETFSRPVTKDGRTTMMPDHWWSFFGPMTPNIQKLAIRILSQPGSASGCERNWSMFEHINSKRRNRFSVEKMNDLVFVHYNLRLRMRKNALVDICPIILDEVDLEAEWANENQTAPGTPTTVFSDDDIDWIDQVDIEAEAVAMAEEEQRARADTGNIETQSDTTVLDVGEHGMVSRGATMAAESSRTYFKRLRRGLGREGARPSEP
ncbi:uncharacterized protein LOC131876326 [Cryptomeria japonica]|uniref:uncharacterized protein LOC131876326 n=1 Tax=Cryptomeria japonica TaxID=3369 RepID=UPI0027D9F81B|nr:uncharacterized protein LOC131876326 [Cryptomeria japonica]